MERNLSACLATLCLSLPGLTNVASRLVMFSLSDKLGRVRTLNILCAMTTPCALLLVFAGGPVYFIVFLVLAFAYGIFLGPNYSGSNYGVIMLALGRLLFSLTPFPLSNAFYRTTGAYTLTVLTCAVAAHGSAGVYFVINRLRRRSEF